MMETPPLLIAQITDTHLLASAEGKLLGLPTEQSLAKVIETIQNHSAQPNRVLLTGDLSQDETLDSYRRLHKHLRKLDVPAYWIPGNHDQPHLMEKVLTLPPAYGDKCFQCGGWQFILLNSAVPGRVYGHLNSETLNWLESQLQTSQLPTLIALHHPPFAVNSDWIDKSRLQNSQELFSVIDRYQQVRLVLFGHIHQDFSRDRAGVRYLATPSSSVQFKPGSQQFALDEMQPPGFRRLWLYPNGKFETDVKRVAFNYTLDLAATGY